MEDVLGDLRRAVVEGEDDLALELVDRALTDGLRPIDVVNRALVAGIQEAGELWKANEYFQSDVIMSAEAFSVTMQVVEPLLTAADTENTKMVVIGTVAGDMHNLGKTIVIAMLRGAGFGVTDLGEDVPSEAFVDAVREHEPDILGVGCYMTPTMLKMAGVMAGLEQAGLRDRVKVMVGGVPTSQEFADGVGADAWGKDALDAVAKARQLMEGRSK